VLYLFLLSCVLLLLFTYVHLYVGNRVDVNFFSDGVKYDKLVLLSQAR